MVFEPPKSANSRRDSPLPADSAARYAAHVRLAAAGARGAGAGGDGGPRALAAKHHHEPLLARDALRSARGGRRDRPRARAPGGRSGMTVAVSAAVRRGLPVEASSVNLPATRATWSWRSDSNRQPPVYKTGALPIAPRQRCRQRLSKIPTGGEDDRVRVSPRAPTPGGRCSTDESSGRIRRYPARRRRESHRPALPRRCRWPGGRPPDPG